MMVAAVRAHAGTDGEPPGEHTAGFAALRHEFHVLAQDPDLGRLLDDVLAPLEVGRRVLPPGTLDAPPPEPVTYLLGSADWVADARPAGRTTVALDPQPDRVLRSLLWHVNRRAIASCPDLCLVHAAVVERDGIGVLLPARMDAGKTTLAAALVLRGHRYLSDEVAVLDPMGGRVYPYPKPLSVDPGSWPLLPELDPRRGSAADRYLQSQWQVPAPRVADGPVTVGVVVAPRYVPGRPTTRVRTTGAEMLAHLASQTFGLARDPRGRMAMLADLVRATTCHTLVTTDLEVACALVDELVARAAAAT